MASTSKAYMLGAGRRAHVKEWVGSLLLIIALAVSSGAADINETAALVQEDFCPEYEYVYPYWSMCYWPLRHFQAFHLVSGRRGGLESTGAAPGMNVVSFTGSWELLGTAYYAVPLVRDPLLGVPVNTDVVLVNSQTLQPLTWTFQAWFRGLVLTEGFSSVDRPAVFRFVRTGEVLACPRIGGARCASYYLVSDSAPRGMTPFNVTEAGPTVIMPAIAGSEILSFLVILPPADAAAAQQSAAASTFGLSVN